MPASQALPQWAPRVPPWKVRRLYELDAQGIYDEDLLRDVGYALLSRCQSFVQAVWAVRGRAPCPACGALVVHHGDKEELLRCACGWELLWGDYFATIQRKQLSGAEPVLALFSDYVTRFPKAKTLPEQMLLIDTLLHGFHWALKGRGPTRPVVVNLLEGRLGDVIAFLDELSYGPHSTPGLQHNKANWDERVVHAKRWARTPRLPLVEHETHPEEEHDD